VDGDDRKWVHDWLANIIEARDGKEFSRRSGLNKDRRAASGLPRTNDVRHFGVFAVV